MELNCYNVIRHWYTPKCMCAVVWCTSTLLDHRQARVEGISRKWALSEENSGVLSRIPYKQVSCWASTMKSATFIINACCCAFLVGESDAWEMIFINRRNWYTLHMTLGSVASMQKWSAISLHSLHITLGSWSVTGHALCTTVVNGYSLVEIWPASPSNNMLHVEHPAHRRHLSSYARFHHSAWMTLGKSWHVTKRCSAIEKLFL